MFGKDKLSARPKALPEQRLKEPKDEERNSESQHHLKLKLRRFRPLL